MLFRLGHQDHSVIADAAIKRRAFLKISSPGMFALVDLLFLSGVMEAKKLSPVTV
ncbi:hypothetical protein ALQ62_101284 [Pseudomonas coronafaciens pv. zizaniae]|nr:hypothetical protein ALQ62_101284 [Pseudomonas coronafaciens pv. zizaniae]